MVTAPNGNIPPGQADNPGANEAPYHGDGRLWTVLPRDGIAHEARRRDGSVAVKFPWWRAVRGRLGITGRRIDNPAAPLRANVLEGYGLTGFQATGIVFPTPGCWEVAAAAGDSRLRFVVLVTVPRV